MQENKAPNPIKLIAQIIAESLLRETFSEKKPENELKHASSLDFSPR